MSLRVKSLHMKPCRNTLQEDCRLKQYIVCCRKPLKSYLPGPVGLIQTLLTSGFQGIRAWAYGRGAE